VLSVDLQEIPLDKHERLRTVRTDVTIESEIESLMAHAVSAFAKFDIVVNNAGIGVGAEPSATSEALFDTTMNVNARSVMFGIKHGAAKMSDGGSVINTASGAGFLGFPTYGGYGASKAAVIMLTKTAAIELGPRRIRVNACAPGTIDTPMQNTETGEAELAISSILAPAGRIGLPDEVASLYQFLASDESAFISGTIIPVDGGISAGISLGTIETLLGSL
jgi:3alpha(or 20beta)-hydroxysteroid dehydrogenase